MGGHTQIGYFNTLAEACFALEQAAIYYFTQFNLYFKAAEIKYDSETLKFELAARFSK